MYKRVCLLVVVCLAFAASGCDTVKPYWKSTQAFYKEYINTNPTVDMKDTGTSDASIRKLADLFTPVDARLEYLLRTLSSQDIPPDDDWCRAFLNVYPWTSGVAVLDESGHVVRGARVSPKPVNFAPLLEFSKRYKDRKMAAAVYGGELGNEILIGKPLYLDGDYKGILVVYFDPGNLVKFAPDPGSLIMVTPGTPLTGDPGSTQALATQNWKNKLKSDVSGELNIGGTTYLWQARYLGQLNLIYAVSAAPHGKGANPPAQTAAPQTSIPQQEVVQPPTGEDTGEHAKPQVLQPTLPAPTKPGEEQ